MNLCMAHRGWSGKAPENTIPAIQLALREPGIQAIEVDVQLSKDGIPVVIHDFTVDRTTNGSGAVADFTWEELAQLDAGSWFHPSYAGERIPTLEEVLELIRGKGCRLNIELKKGGNLYQGMEQKVLELIDRCGVRSDVCITSFNHEAIQIVGELDPDIPKGLIIYGKPLMIREQLRLTGATILSMAYPYLTQEFVTDMINEGITMIAWTIDDPEHIRQTMKLHPQLHIATNYPDRMINPIKV